MKKERHARIIEIMQNQNIITIKDLAQQLNCTEMTVRRNLDELQNMNFVITGSVEHFANRGEVKELIESLGGKVTGSVTSKTNYLINNDVTSTSSKNKKANELGVPIISEEQFIKMVEEQK